VRFDLIENVPLVVVPHDALLLDSAGNRHHPNALRPVTDRTSGGSSEVNATTGSPLLTKMAAAVLVGVFLSADNARGFLSG
jgi:hypothetical protein